MGPSLLIAAVLQGLLVLCFSPCCQVTVLPGWRHPLARMIPATFTPAAIRTTWINGALPADIWPQLANLLIAGAIFVPPGLAVFQAGERYALRTGKLKRNGQGR